MSVAFYNTMTRALQEFTPREPGKVGLYTCGPTIYNYAHIGNFRAYVFEDLLKRYLQYRGYHVHHIMNLTDVEDKLIRTCRETGQSLKEITAKYAQAFFEDLDTLGIVRADAYPAATDFIPEMIDIIKTLRDKGHTYEANGSIYFRLSSFPGYGRLSHMDLQELREGASGRVDNDEYETEDARDFALWKAYVPEDGDVYWETELGKGRPGWHIECSAMAMKYLGPSFDIHCGGVDNIFPHHENEIAQSECCTGKTFVNYWLHCAHLVVEGRKMSKSLGNFYTLRDLTAQGKDPLAIRWVLLATHYRQPNNFSFDALDAAKNSLDRIRDFRTRLTELASTHPVNLENPVNPVQSPITGLITTTETNFTACLDDDLNISGALGAIFDFIRETNKLLDERNVTPEGAHAALALLDRLNTVTGILAPKTIEEVPQHILDQVAARQAARRNKDFKQSDAIRDALLAEGWVVEDTAQGPRVKRG